MYHGHGWQPGSQSFQSWFLLGACIYKRISLTEAIAALQQARSLQPKASILFALGEANSSKKSTTRRFKISSWFKVKTQ